MKIKKTKENVKFIIYMWEIESIKSFGIKILKIFYIEFTNI